MILSLSKVALTGNNSNWCNLRCLKKTNEYPLSRTSCKNFKIHHTQGILEGSKGAKPQRQLLDLCTNVEKEPEIWIAARGQSLQRPLKT